MTLVTTEWPARLLCDRFPNFPVWIGDLCDVECFFGEKDSQNRLF